MTTADAQLSLNRFILNFGNVIKNGLPKNVPHVIELITDPVSQESWIGIRSMPLPKDLEETKDAMEGLLDFLPETFEGLWITVEDLGSEEGEA